jgi:deoxyribodipyrimidine photo-lyase
MKKFTVVNPNILVNGGRKEGIKLLRRAKKTQTKYIKTRNDLSGSTSQLSAFIKFGCVSIREVYHEMKEIKDFSRQLVWRDFYANIMFEYSHVMGKPMKLRYENIKWDNNMIWFKAWCNGKTGFPIVDAGMTELNTTGYCHNRSRLIVMSFLIKIMFIDWRKGEKYFATQLIDYDPSSNNGNTQWVAGSGADSQMYNRIFNPWTQAKTYDPCCKYIKKWLPQLKDVPNSDIFNWDTKWKDYSHVKYIKPICDYKKQREIVLKSYTKALFVSK